MSNIQTSIIDSLLPQTQCEKCGYKGCQPYAEAITRGEADINLCHPGGIPTMQALAKLMNTSEKPLPVEAEHAQTATVAVIRDEHCIGCTKCIKACPVEAIIGATKQLHGIIAKDCTGCELCLPVCPVDCIDMVPAPANHIPTWIVQAQEPRIQKAEHSRELFHRRQNRLQAESQRKQDKDNKIITHNTDYASDIAAAMARVKQKRQQKPFKIDYEL
jgi:electron transport complex protein RnfB